MSAYALAQSGRNVLDYSRVWDHHIQKTTPQNNRLYDSGINKINQIGVSKRRFYSTNAFNFLVFLREL